MLTINEIVNASAIVANEYPIKTIALFGSYASGLNTKDSDVDILVEFDTDAISLLVISSVKYRMEELLGVSVDIVHAPIPETSLLELGKVVKLYAA